MEFPSPLPDQVMALVATERAIEEGLSRQADITLTHPRLHASLAAMQAQAGIQRQDLENYLGQEAPEPTEPRSPLAPLLAEASSSMKLSSLLPAYCAAFSFAANEYSVLIALTLHLYDPALRELARKHLSSYAKAARLLTHLLPGAIVEDLDRQGLECRCICPMCSIGACGCTAAGCGYIQIIELAHHGAVEGSLVRQAQVQRRRRRHRVLEHRPGRSLRSGDA
jgi:hypothetical protein